MYVYSNLLCEAIQKEKGKKPIITTFADTTRRLESGSYNGIKVLGVKKDEAKQYSIYLILHL